MMYYNFNIVALAAERAADIPFFFLNSLTERPGGICYQCINNIYLHGCVRVQRVSRLLPVSVHVTRSFIGARILLYSP